MRSTQEPTEESALKICGLDRAVLREEDSPEGSSPTQLMLLQHRLDQSFRDLRQTSAPFTPTQPTGCPGAYLFTVYRCSWQDIYSVNVATGHGKNLQQCLFLSGTRVCNTKVPLGIPWPKGCSLQLLLLLHCPAAPLPCSVRLGRGQRLCSCGGSQPALLATSRWELTFFVFF